MSLFLLGFFVKDIQPDNADQYRCDGKRITDHAGDTAHVNVVDQPAGETDQVQNPDHPRIVDTQSDRGNKLGNDHKNTERTVPGKKSQKHKHDAEDDLKDQRAFAFFVSVPVNAIGKATGKIDTHACVTAQENIVDRRKKGIADLAKYDAVVLFLLHTDNNKGCAHKSNDLRQ